MYPEFIGKGNGKRLIKSVIELSNKKFAKRIILDADPNAQKFYEHFGFSKYDELESSIKNRFLPQMELIIK
jgi:predicted GNAT family N-acyltransferase